MDLALLQYFSHLPKLKEAMLMIIQQGGSNGIGTRAIRWNVGIHIGVPFENLEDVLQHHWVIAQLDKARQKLKEEHLIGYNSKTKVWYPQRSKEYSPSLKEQKFIERRIGRGWRRIKSSLEAIEWLHTNLTPDEFEHFCIAILSEHCGVDVKITEKRRYSGADGGFDGIGTCLIEGKQEEVAVQAKRYKMDGQVSQDHCQKFIGALTENEMKHGFMITTGIFSERSLKTIEKVKKFDIWIEAIDQNRLANIMLEKSNLPHGFGLYKTDIDWFYIHEGILRKAGKKKA